MKYDPCNGGEVQSYGPNRSLPLFTATQTRYTRLSGTDQVPLTAVPYNFWGIGQHHLGECLSDRSF